MPHNPRPVAGEDPWGAKFDAWIDEVLSEKMPTAGPALFGDKTSGSNLALRAAAGDAVVYVTTGGVDANDGLSWGTAKATLQAAHDALPAGGGDVFLSGETFTITTRVNISKPVRFIGAGRDITVLSGGVDSDYMFLRTGTTDLAGVEFCDLTLDLAGGTNRSGIRVEYVTRFAVRRCRIRNITMWGLTVGTMLGSDATIRNSDVTIEDSEFDGITGTTEQLLLFNSRDVVVRDCRFNAIGVSGYGIGFYQNLDGVLVDGCHFAGPGTGAYYSLSTNNVSVTSSRFVCAKGLAGANQSDNGAFGFTTVRGLTVADCVFSTTGASFGLQLGATTDAKVVACTFYRCQEIALIISSGNTPVNSLPKNLAIIGCSFRENNQSGTLATLHPAIYIAAGAAAPELGLLLAGCVFEDNQATATQLYPLTFNGAFAYDTIRIVGNRIKAGTGGVSILLVDGATLGSVVDIYGNLSYSGAGLGGVEENIRLGATGAKVGFFGAVPVVRPAALTASAAAAPAGGTGTSAGAWDTAANRDAAIATINNLKTRVDEMETKLRALGLLT